MARQSPPQDFYKFSNYYMGRLHSLKVAGFLSNPFPMMPLETISKYEGYYYDSRGKSKESILVRRPQYLACFKHGVKVFFKNLDGIEKIMKEAYKNQKLTYWQLSHTVKLA